MFYKVVNWNTGETITEVASLAVAKKHCRSMGHEAEPYGKWYPPIAYVQNERGECVYNPRFRVGKERD